MAAALLQCSLRVKNCAVNGLADIFMIRRKGIELLESHR